MHEIFKFNHRKITLNENLNMWISVQKSRNVYKYSIFMGEQIELIP
jgi:hypothetical protein